MSTAWVVRTGKYGERDLWALEGNVTGGGWLDVPDLTSTDTWDAVLSTLRGALGQQNPRTLGNYAGQLWALRSRISPGDLMVLPLKTSTQIALGRVTGGYEYLADPDPSRRHIVRVDWQRVDVPRTAIKQDLLYTLGAFLTVFQPTRNDAVWRLEQVLSTGSDPGARAGLTPTQEQPSSPLIGLPDETEVSDPSVVDRFDLEEFARTRIQTLIQEDFGGHDLARLVEAILTVEGFVCERKPPGADGGVDILAGCGPLGLDAPRLVVQVKSDASPVGDPVVQTLQGAMTRFQADQALLVAWGGVSRQAQKFLETTKFTIRVWDADRLIAALLRNYTEMPEALRSELPMKQVWVPVERDL